MIHQDTLQFAPELIRRRISVSQFKVTLVVWLRHFGCRFYQEAKVLLPDLQAALIDHGIGLQCVVQGDYDELSRFWPFEDIGVIGDPTRESYREMQLPRTSLFKILLPESDLKDRRYQATSLGCKMDSEGTKTHSSDILQLPGMALVASDGSILWKHISRHTGDLDLSLQLVDVLQGVISDNQNLALS